MNLEIERKFLLKRLPNEKPHDIIKMDQWYLNVNGIYERVRQRQWKSTGKIDWIHTIKEFVDEMSNIEIEKFISIDEYHEFIKKCKDSNSDARYIQKRRYLYKNGNDTWEVDEFLETSLIVAEIEIPNKEYEVIIPNHISDNLICEVTGMREFSNKNLSDKI
jgi:CYTH domain-containing protein